MMQGMTIAGVGAYLPDDVRGNDWWPNDIVSAWKADRHTKVTSLKNRREDPPSPGAGAVLDAMRDLGDDPFLGARERRVIGPDQLPSDMEVRAAEQAMAHAGVTADDIDLMMVYSVQSDRLLTPNTSAVQERLGLPRECVLVSTDAACNSFLTQLRLAEGMIRSGLSQCALLVQSIALSRIIPQKERYSTWFGDGATAVVVRPCDAREGVIASSHKADGSYYDAIYAGVPGKPPHCWFEAGPLLFQVSNRAVARKTVMMAADLAKDVLDDVFEKADIQPEDVQFYAGHQANAWFRSVTQDFVGMRNARTLDTFPWAGNIAAGNIPLVMRAACDEGLLRPGDLVAAYGGGAGMTWSAAVMRWTA